MQIGASHRLLWNLSLEKSIQKLAEIGYRCIELWAEPPHLVPSQLSKNDRVLLRNLLVNMDVEPTLHATSWDLNISSLNPFIRKISIDLVKESIDLAADIEAGLVAIHPGRTSSSKGEGQETRSILMDALRELVESADSRGLVLALENMEQRPREVITTPNDLRTLIKEMNSPRLVGLVDVAHANTVADPVGFLRECLGILGHIHISDNNGSAPTHLPLGKGTIDLARIFQTLIEEEYDGKVVIEGFFSSDPVGTAKADFDYSARLIQQLGSGKKRLK